MTKGVCTFAGKPAAIFQTIMDVTIPLSIGTNEITFLLLLVTAIFLGLFYSKHLRIYINNLVGHKVG